jgi:hypothetical protein
VRFFIATLSIGFSLFASSQSFADELHDSQSKTLVVSVADNSESSPLNAEHLIAAINGREADYELLEHLGQPVTAERVFPHFEGSDFDYSEHLNREVAHTLSIMHHYVSLNYSSEADLLAIEERLSDDEHFAFVQAFHPGGFSLTPNDPNFLSGGSPDPDGYQWGLGVSELNLPGAWDRNTGWAHVGILDGGVPAISVPGGNPPYEIDHNDLFQVVSKNHSWKFYGSPPSADLSQSSIYKPHGTHVVGIVAANTNNAIGTSGICWNCSVLFGMIAPHVKDISGAFTWLALWGAQSINFSGFMDDSGPGHPCVAFNWDINAGAAPSCVMLKFLKQLEVNVVAASGNDKAPVNFPASDESVISVGGYDVRGDFWNEQLWMDPWDYASGPYAGCPDYWTAPEECGSNFGLEQHFVAPSRRVLSTVPYGSAYSADPTDDYCNDLNFGLASDGVAYCTGTSMAAPHVTGVVSLLRSVNPLLGRVDTFNAIKQTASNPITHDLYIGWGSPDAGAAVVRTLGKVGGLTVRNRATPMFGLKVHHSEGVGNAVTKDRLYTTRPQVANGGFFGIYLATPTSCSAGWPDCNPAPSSSQTYRSYISVPSTEGSPVAGYPRFPAFINPQINYVPRSAFWVMTSHYSPWPGVTLKPLHRLSFREQCDWRDHVYTTEQTGIDYLTSTDFCPESGTQSYKLDGIEGYILGSCPTGMSCNGSNPTEPQKLYRRYSDSDEQYALLIENQLSNPVFASYTYDPFAVPPANGVLGYVLPNVDSDGDHIPDAMERMLGLDHLSSDSDCDGVNDGVELPISGLQPSGLDPLLGGKC